MDADQVRFARRLIDGGVDLVHGHSSHHPRPIEVFRGKLILYGCGDCIDDYEGITGHQAYRSELRLLYFASVEEDTGHLSALQMAPMRARKLRLRQAPAADRQWLRTVLERISRGFGSRVDLRPDGMLALRPPPRAQLAAEVTRHQGSDQGRSRPPMRLGAAPAGAEDMAEAG